MINILLVDDHEIVRTGLRSLLLTMPGVEIIGEAKSGLEALQSVKTLRPNVVLMDISMPGIDGLETTRKILRYDPQIKVIIISVLNQDPFPGRVFDVGATGYLSKECHPHEVMDAIRTVLSGGRYIPPEIVNQLALRQVPVEGRVTLDVLSLRELQIVLMIIKGKNVKEIAKLFYISEKTIKANRQRIFKKLKIHSDVQLILLADKLGLLNEKLW